MAGVSELGFEAKRLADVVAEAEAQLSTIVDPVTGSTLAPALNSSDPAMQIVKVPLDGIAAGWEALQLVYEQFDPHKAQGSSLESLVQLNGLSRLPATPSTVTLTLTGTAGSPVNAGTVVSDVDSAHLWSTDATVTLDGGGSATVGATCQDFGAITATPGSINQIVTPVVGLASVTNAADASVGAEQESITALRVRRNRSTLAPASGPIEAIYANVANIPGVTYSRAYQNNTLTTDARGIAAKSVAQVVVGGDDDVIAMTLLQRTGVVSGWHGSTSVTIRDSQDEPYVVKFSRPTALPIYLAVSIEVYNPAVFPSDGVAQIKQAIIDYAQGGAPALGVEDGFGESGFPPGSSVLRSRLFTPLNFIPGHRVATLTLGTAPAPAGTADIAVDWDEFAEFDAARIAVTVL